MQKPTTSPRPYLHRHPFTTTVRGHPKQGNAFEPQVKLFFFFPLLLSKSKSILIIVLTRNIISKWMREDLKDLEEEDGMIGTIEIKQEDLEDLVRRRRRRWYDRNN